ncbi:MAG: hypothetical protein AB7P02_16430 [Alphaproteobacteria bacterium]
MVQPPYDRIRLLAALRSLGSSDDETVLQAARAAAEIASAAGGWETLLVEAASVPPDPIAAAPADDAGRIAALLALPTLSPDARESLMEIAADRSAGTLREEDRTWLRALHERLIPRG